MGADATTLIQTLGFPIVAAAAAGFFGYKVVFYVLRNLHEDIKNLHDIIIKLIDRINEHDKETNKLGKEIAMLRVEVASLYKCLGAAPKKANKRGGDG